jgi:cation-transporting ATPase 13A3/4/5
LNAVLEHQTEQGYRVIAIGYRTYPPVDIIRMKKLHRDEVECHLTFAGLIIFENKLKPQTTSVIDNLQQANMKLVMLTGGYKTSMTNV